MNTLVICEVGSNFRNLDDLVKSARFAYSQKAIPKAQLWHTCHLCSRERDPKQFSALKEYEIPRSWYKRLIDEGYFFSVFCPDIVDHVEDLAGPIYYKIASPECNNAELIKKVKSYNKKMIISESESHPMNSKTLKLLDGTPFYRLHCVCSYPADSAYLSRMSSEFDGISDHTTSILVPAFAVARGASIVEKHFKIDALMDTPDAGHSLNPEEFARMISFIRDAEFHLKEDEDTTEKEKANLLKALRGKDGLRPSV